MLKDRLSVLDDKEIEIIRYLASQFHLVRFSDIQKKVELSSAHLTYKLRKLIKLGLVRKATSGAYEIMYKTPLSYIYCDDPECSYIGLLGLKEGREVPEPIIALELLGKAGINPSRKYILATKESISDWSNQLSEFKDFNIRTLRTEDTVNISKVEIVLENIIEAEKHETVIILDCTSLTKTATIAFYKQAIKHYAPLIYIYENTKTLIWLQSKEEIMNNLGLRRR